MEKILTNQVWAFAEDDQFCLMKFVIKNSIGFVKIYFL